jgi:hypothetical protein
MTKSGPPQISKSVPHFPKSSKENDKIWATNATASVSQKKDAYWLLIFLTLSFMGM